MRTNAWSVLVREGRKRRREREISYSSDADSADKRGEMKETRGKHSPR